MKGFTLPKRYRLISTALLFSLVMSGIIGVWAISPKQQARAGSPVYAALLLIHGFHDSCNGAFNSYEGASSPTNEDTVTYLQSKGWGYSWNPIDEIGYYSDDNESSCNNNVYDIDNTALNAPKHCVTVNSGESNPNIAFGYTNDPIRHIACELAWYIYNTYTVNYIPVYVLAHSMGGLIIRDAIAEAGISANFPPAIDVRRAVTVATPHGGEYGDYNQAAQFKFGNSVELEDMLPGSSHSSFMQTISGGQYQSPNGSSGTSWYLMAASDGCNAFANGGKQLSCGAEAVPLNDRYPDGDGTIQSATGVQMSGAQEKVLYGVVDYVDLAGLVNCSSCFIADPNTQYEHEANSKLAPPYYLNDTTAGEQATKAWVCHAPNCTDGDNANYSDMNVGDNTAVLNPCSLQQISDWLPAPPAPTPTPTFTPIPTCSSTNETDNIQPSGTNPYTDYRGNTWYVYYDIKRDAPTNEPCQMRVVVRIFSPYPDGTWGGKVGVLAELHGKVVNGSAAQVGGTGNYQYHFVWRGPWFSAGAGVYTILDTEYNGSNPYGRASASFTI